MEKVKTLEQLKEDKTFLLKDSTEKKEVQAQTCLSLSAFCAPALKSFGKFNWYPGKQKT